MPPEDPIYTRDEILRRHGISGSTLARWIRQRKHPPPDIAPTRERQQWREPNGQHWRGSWAG